MSKRPPRKRKSLPARSGEQATPERHLQQGGVRTEVVDRDAYNRIIIKRQRATIECALDRYFLQEKLNENDYEAGMKFRRAYLRAVLKVKVDDSGAGSHGDFEMATLIVIASDKLLRQAYAILSPAQKSVVINVCGHDFSAGDTYRLETLRRGLNKLAILWNFV